MLFQKRLTYLDFVKCHVSWLADFIKSDLIKFADLNADFIGVHNDMII